MSDSGWRGTARSRARDLGRGIGRGGRAAAHGVAKGSRATSARFQRFARADGADSSGLARFVELHGVTIASGGVIPNIHSVQLPKKSGKAEK